jgi:hypothetical protein
MPREAGDFYPFITDREYKLYEESTSEVVERRDRLLRRSQEMFLIQRPQGETASPKDDGGIEYDQSGDFLKDQD